MQSMWTFVAAALKAVEKLCVQHLKKSNQNPLSKSILIGPERGFMLQLNNCWEKIEIFMGV